MRGYVPKRIAQLKDDIEANRDLFRRILAAVKEGRAIRLPYLGRIQARTYIMGNSLNPKTKESMCGVKYTRIRFNASKEAKDFVNGRRSAVEVF